MTKPKMPKGLRVSDVDSTSCKIHWLHPEKHHSCLKSYQIKIRSADNKFSHDVTPLRQATSWNIRHGMLQQCMDYDITVSTLCVKGTDSGSIKTESDAANYSFTTPPESVKNLKLENSTPNSLTVKWDIPTVTNGIKFVLGINANTGEDEADDDANENENEENKEINIKDYEVNNIEVAPDKNQYTFSDIPKITGTGHAYDITVVTVYTSPRDVEVKSKEYKERFMTRPLPPTKLSVAPVGDNEEKSLKICWNKSVTPNMTGYKVRWKPLHQSEETVIKTDEESINAKDQTFFSFPPERVQVGTVYKVNVYAVVESGNLSSESKELHEKFEITSATDIEVYVEKTENE